MRATVFAMAWMFIFGAAAYDSYFAWQYRAVIASWELNPMVLWAVERVGLIGVFVFKFAGLLLAAGLAWHCRPRQLARNLTVVVVCAYVVLSLHYVVGHQQSPSYEFASRSFLMRQSR